MKSSLPEADRHDENVTQWDDYKACEILSILIGTGYLAAEKQIINR
jgi:hypothetical protein